MTETSTPQAESIPSPESAAKFHAVFEAAVDGIVTIDADGSIQDFNPAAERLFGYRAEEVRGRNVSLLMPSPYREEHDGYIRRYLRTGEKRIIGTGREVSGLRKDGTTFPLYLGVSEARVDGRRFFTGITRDLSERNRADAAVRQSQARYQSVIHAAANVVFSVSPEHRITEWNASAARVFGATREEVLGKPYFELFPLPPHYSAIESGWRRAFAAGEVHDFESPIIGRDGVERLLLWNMSRLPEIGDLPEGVLVIGQDISERRKLEAQFRQQEKLAAVGLFAAGVAHEIGNPLASIAAATQNAIRKCTEPVVAEKLQLIDRHLQRIGATVRQLVTFSQPGALERKPCQINQVLAETVEILRYDRRARNVEIVLDLAEALPPTWAIPDQLHQVFVNLALNAFDALESARGAGPGRLTIRTALRRFPGREVIAISFEDTGPGIQPEIITRIMEPFFTTKEVGRGTGLGLSVSWGIVREHGGQIRCESRPGEGARFTVEIPVRATGDG